MLEEKARADLISGVLALMRSNIASIILYGSTARVRLKLDILGTER